MNNQTTRFNGNILVNDTPTPATLAVKLRNGKKGFNISVSLKAEGQPTQTMCQETFIAETEAQTCFDRRANEAETSGWTRVQRSAKVAPVMTIPVAVAVAPIVPETAPAVPETAPVAKTNGAKRVAKPRAAAASKS